MNIVLLATTFDLLGRVVIKARADSTNGTIRRRANRVATLDGAAAFNDFGYSESDRDLDYTWRTRSAEHNASVARLVQQYAFLRVCTPGGVFLAKPVRFTPGTRESSINLLVKEKLA